MENEQKQGLVKSAETRLPKFVEDAYESVEKMEQFATILLNSKLVPNHFYEQLPDKKPDFSKGKVPAVVAVLIQGYQLQLPPLTALQHIIPVNGLLSIKGDLAKSMIFNSGKLKTGSWVEEETGSIEAGDYMVKITATRSDNGQTLSRSFSVAQAKRAGLWITEQQVNGQDGWKYKSSAWWKYPTRMCNYRALGFIARDMFPDVMAGIYTTEEAQDIGKETTEVIETESGAKIIIPDKEHSKERSGKMTSKTADKIRGGNFAPIDKEEPEEAQVVSEELPFTGTRGSSEYLDGKLIRVDGCPVDEDGKPIPPSDETAEDEDTSKLTLKEMEGMETINLLSIINEDMDMMEAMELIPGKNTNKKLREIIFANQGGNLADHLAKLLNEAKEDTETIPAQDNAEEIAGGGIPTNKDFDNEPAEKQAGTPTGNADILQPDKKAKDESTEDVEAGNKYNITIPEFDKGEQRDFATMKQVFNLLASVEPPVNNPRYLELAAKMGILAAMPDRESFAKVGTVKLINDLLNMN